MNLVWWLFGLIVGAWAVTLMTLGFAEAMLRKRHAERLAIRDFHEKIDAMRRMADREGDA